MSDAEALAAALCPMSRLRPGAFDRCAVHGAHIDYATAILAALHESGWTVERAGEVARLRERLAEVVDYAVEVEVYDPDTGPYKTMAVSHETIEAARLALAAQPTAAVWGMPVVIDPTMEPDTFRLEPQPPAAQQTAPCGRCGHDRGFAHATPSGHCRHIDPEWGRCDCPSWTPTPEPKVNA